MVTIDFAKGGGVVPVIVQDHATGEVLMLAYMNQEAWEKTLSTGKAHYYSRSRARLWMKGETSGHIQEVKTIAVDCDADTILITVDQHGGAACHEGYRSCFFRSRLTNGEWQVCGERVFDPATVYGKSD
ncbi:MAG: phosphoribosyl-AMP cyclohydrolase [Candidatus Binatia bacterium]|nr:phosphoribosyl-AMP cyclohydrolase [Candidatus Binatia bacterium]